MSLIVKIMQDHYVPDEQPGAPHILIADVKRVILDHHLTDEVAFLHVWIAGQEEPERHRLFGNVYVMTEAGKTVQVIDWRFPSELRRHPDLKAAA